MNTTHRAPLADDLDIAALLQRAGGRDQPPAPVEEDVRTCVHAEWQDIVRERNRRRRRIVNLGLAAAVATIACATLLVFSPIQNPTVTVASIAHIDGHLIASSSEGPMPSIDAGQAVVAGESLRTDAHSRAALLWPGGLSLRMDHDTAIKVISQTKVALIRGALYIDANRSEALAIESTYGTVRHLGTQYMVAVQPDILEVRIREGRVSIEGSGSSLVGSAGERIEMSAMGAIERTTLNPADTSWDWAVASAPTFPIDNQSLSAFLTWVSRQTGRPIVFESREAQAAAAHVILRGSIEGLDVDTALSVVLSTTQLHRYSTAGNAIGIALNSEQQVLDRR